MQKQCLWLLALLLFFPLYSSQNLPSGCYESYYTSTFTNCDLTFLFCYSSQILTKCTLRQCERYIRGGDCNFWVDFVLTNQTCYKTCCGANVFNEQACDSYNAQAAEQQKSVETGFIVILVLVAVGLCAVVAWMSYRHMRCCDKSEPFKIMKYNIHWKRDEYADSKCEICHTYGPLLFAPCNHAFHVSCFEQNSKDMVCPKCEVQIRERVKIFCFSCREYSFKARVYKNQHISEAIEEGKGLHYDLCPKQIKTGRKLTESDERL